MKSMLNEKEYYKMISSGIFTKLFKKAIKENENILIVGKIGTGTNTLATSLSILGKKYKVYDYFKNILNSTAIFPIKETPYIIVSQANSIESALSELSNFAINIKYAVHMADLNNIDNVKILERKIK